MRAMFFCAHPLLAGKSRMFKKKGKGNKEVTSQEKRIAIDIGFYSIKFAYFKDDLLCLEEFPLFDQPRDLTELKRKVLVETLSTNIAKALTLVRDHGMHSSVFVMVGLPHEDLVAWHR